jgi:hypothetical protein
VDLVKDLKQCGLGLKEERWCDHLFLIHIISGHYGIFRAFFSVPACAVTQVNLLARGSASNVCCGMPLILAGLQCGLAWFVDERGSMGVFPRDLY